MMNEPANSRWRSHVNSLTARILEESGYRTNLDFAQLRIRELLGNASITCYDVENLLCGLYTEENRWRDKIDHMPNYNLSDKALKQRIWRICNNAGFFDHPEWLTEITVGDFLELEGLDEVTIPELLSELVDTIQDISDKNVGNEPFDELSYYYGSFLGDSEYIGEDSLEDITDDLVDCCG